MAQGHAVNEGPVIREILGHLGEPTSAPRLARRAVRRYGSCRWPDRLRQSRKLIRWPNQRQTTISTSASPGEATALQGGRAKDALLAVADGRDEKRQGLRLVAGWQVMVPPGRVRFPGEFSRFSRLTWSEKRGDTYFGGVEFPILWQAILDKLPDGTDPDHAGKHAQSPP